MARSPNSIATAAESSAQAQPFGSFHTFRSSTTAAGADGQRSTTPSSDLHHAAEAGNLQQIQSILANCGSNERSQLLKHKLNGELPLHCAAARGGHKDTLELLMPIDLPELVNAECENGGWSALHFAAAYGHAEVVQWLVLDRKADLDLQDKEGNTPTHLAVAREYKAVVECLVVAQGADVSIPNRENMMPISFCSDESMFEALLPAYLPGSKLLARAHKNSWQICLASDGDGRNILHYAAQFSRNPHSLAQLIRQFGQYKLGNRDHEGDSFLHIAAKSGNMPLLQALQELWSIRVDVPELITTSGADLEHSPALYALLHEHRSFFDKITTMDSTAKVTLGCIISALTEQLQKDPNIRSRLALFASSLPTYLALYAKKDSIFDFLLETKEISLTQWDCEYHRTCLHWAALHGRTDIVEKLCKNYQISPAILDRNGRTAFEYASANNDQIVMDTMRATQVVQADEEKLYKDRDVYIKALNGILVVATLIAGVAFEGYLHLTASADLNSRAMKTLWVSSTISFFTAAAAMCVTINGLLPMPHKYVVEIADTLKFAIVVDAILLAVSIAAMMCAFAAVGFAITEGWTSAYHMWATIGVGGGLAILMWIGFLTRVAGLAIVTRLVFVKPQDIFRAPPLVL